MLAFQLDNLLFLLLLAVAGLFQLLAKAASKRKEDQAPPTTPPPAQRTRPIPRAAPQSDQDRVRKLLEALGNPTASQPPPPIPQRPTYRRRLVLPRIPQMGSPLPPLVTRPPDLPAEIQVPARTPPIPIESPEKPAVSAEQTFEVHEPRIAPEPNAVVTVAAGDELGEPTLSVAAQDALDVTRLLRSPSALRDAIILREVLGPPRGLRALEVIGS
jgi:hypothetical protein